jgi:hypothetical protein
MALSNCRECKATVSTEAAACPHCGAPNPVKTDSSAPGEQMVPPPKDYLLPTILISVLVVMGVVAYALLLESSPASSSPGPRSAPPVPKAAPTAKVDSPGYQLGYERGYTGGSKVGRTYPMVDETLRRTVRESAAEAIRLIEQTSGLSEEYKQGFKDGFRKGYTERGGQW